MNSNRPATSRLARSLVTVVALGACLTASAATRELVAGQSFEAAVESLAPGDTLVVHAGTYIDAGRIAITVKGTETAPVVIRAATGEARPVIARRAGDPVQNTIDVVGATYLTIAGLEISNVPDSGGDGVNLSGGPSYVTLDDLRIHDVSVGVNFRSSMHHITVRRSEIFNTSGTGEGLYVGCHDGSCVVHDALIEGNYVHHTRGSEQGDGIEIKRGSYANVVRDNVVHDTLYPCIIAYGTEGNARNVIERNVVWNCDDTGMQIAADAIVRNNVVLQTSGGGFTSQDHAGVTPNNLEFVHNTVVGGSPCVRLGNWSGKSGLVFANNAIYCDDGYALSALAGVTAAGNVFSSAPPSFASSSYRLGRSAAQDLTDVAGRNAYPTGTSTLIGAAANAWITPDDFNGTSRNATSDAGAYVRTGSSNPGCAITTNFKCAGAPIPPAPSPAPPPAPPPAPQVSLAASPTSVAFQGTTTLTWTSTNATSCTAEGDWSGTKALNGTETTGALEASRSYGLRCVNSAGTSALSSVSITVAAAPAPAPAPPPAPTPPPPPAPDPAAAQSGGGGEMSSAWLALLAAFTTLSVTRRAPRRLARSRATT